MKRNLTSLVVLISILLGLVSSASAQPLASSTSQLQTGQPPAESVVARVYFTGQDDLNKLASRYDILEINHEQGFALIILNPQAYTALQHGGYRLEIDEGKTRLLNQPAQALPGQGTDTIPGYPCYRTVEETYLAMQLIVSTYPGMAQMFDIGNSWDKVTAGGPAGYDILALRLTNEQFGDVNTKPTLFLMAEIHAREYTTAETAMRYAEYLVENYGIDPDVTWLLDYFRVFIVTMTNPDGRKKAETGQLWRKNVDSDDGCSNQYYWGTDLNRNHNFKWVGGGSSTDPCDETYRGPSAASEPETQAIQNFVLTLFSDQRGPGDTDPAPDDTTGVFVTLHSYARVVLYPWGWTSSPSPNATDLATLGRKFGFFNNYEVCQADSTCMYLTNGTSDDWSYGNLGIASFTFEIGTDFFESCSSFESTTYPENLPALLYAFKAARRPYQNPAGPDTLNISAAPSLVEEGDPVLLAATADDTRYNSNGHGTEPTHNISAARYSIDNPSWIAGTPTYSIAPGDGSFDTKVEDIQATIDTTGLSTGRHTVFIESMDVNNNWGVPSAIFLNIIDPGASPVINGHVRDVQTNQPLPATVTAGIFSTTTDPATGYYSMTVYSGTYDIVVEADNFSPGYANGVVAHDYETITQDFLLYPYCTIYSDDVENGNQGWTAQSPWAITTSSSHSSTHAWTDSPSGSYGNNVDVKLTSPTFDLSGYTGVSLAFWHKYLTQPGADFANVEYSTDGVNWTQVETYSGIQNYWSNAHIPLPGLDGQANARIRFRLSSNSSVMSDGWYLDDISLISGGPGCLDLLPPTAEFTSTSPVPLDQPVYFTNLTTGTPPITYTWDFGDGVGTSTETNPVYTYADINTYTVTLTATNPHGIDVIQHPITIHPIVLTGVDLTQLTSSPIFPGTLVDFTADLLPDDATMPYDYTIDYGDGTEVSGSSSLDLLLLSHTYSHSGSYPVLISVWNAGQILPVIDALNVYVLSQVFLPMTMK